MKSSCIGKSGEDFLKILLKSYRITRIDMRSCLLVSKRTNMSWKIEILSGNELDSAISVS